MDQHYRLERAMLRGYLTAILDTVDGIHRAMAHGDLKDAARYADDLKALGSSCQASMGRIQRAVSERLRELPAGDGGTSERSTQ